MNTIVQLGRVISVLCVAVGVLSVMLPQKRTRKMMSFVIGLFFLSSLVGTLSSSEINLNNVIPEENIEPPTYSEQDYTDAVAQMTADCLTQELGELLLNEGIVVDDIQLKLKITDEGRITAARVVIYMSEQQFSKKDEVRRIVYGNLAKEPEIYVSGQKAQ